MKPASSHQKIFAASSLIFIAGLILSCGSRSDSPEGLLKQARTEIDEAKYTSAIASLKRLVKTYPRDPLAAEGQYMLGDTYMAYTKDFEKAVKEYRKVASSYPDSRFAVNAQFMLGYVYANFMEDFEKARQEYETFLELYSDRADSGLVQSVRFELENLGEELDQIPELRHITS